MRLAAGVMLVALAAACGADDTAEQPERLSTTGLYADIGSGALADGVRAFRPRYELWSDGATKRRWLWIPPGTRIDTADMDAWKFPVGTKVWKEFVRDGVRVETRLLQKIGPGAQEWTLVAYVWSADQKEATAAPGGQPDALGTSHDVPDTAKCKACHSGSADTVLGVSAIQLDHDLGDLNLAALASEGLITVPPSAKYEVPGNDVERAALGYLHANCGHCHNTRAAKPPIPLRLALTIGALGSVKETPIYKTTVGIRTETPKRLEDTTLTTIIVPSDPDASLLRLRMLRRAPESGAMPPVGSEVVDMAGSDAVTAWIRTLAP